MPRNNRFKIAPENPSTLFIEFKPRIEPSQDSGCASKRPKRLRQSIVMKNSCFSVKQKVVITFQTDTDAAMLCDGAEAKGCRGGHREASFSFPSQQLYWQGDEKTLVRFLCWGPNDHDPDFNLTVNVDVTAVSAGSTPDELENLSDSTLFVINASIIEEA